MLIKLNRENSNQHQNLTHSKQRIYLNRETVDFIENQIRIGRHLERYALVRQFVYGKVLDIACGVGYGSYLLAKNPDVKKIVGVDVDRETVAWETNNFRSGKIDFLCDTVENFSGEFDFLVSLETIEHLETPGSLYDLVLRCGINEVVISFPHKKSTHYNQFHLWDITPVDVFDIFSDFVCINEIEHYNSTILHLIRRRAEIIPPKRL
jgi:SAM-dependent methyltransferase